MGCDGALWGAAAAFGGARRSGPARRIRQAGGVGFDTRLIVPCTGQNYKPGAFCAVP